MFKDRKLLVTGGTGSIGSSICNYFNNNHCKEIFSTTTNLNKVRSDQGYIYFLDELPSEINPISIGIIFIFSILITALASFFPAKVISKMNVTKALKYE